MFGRNRLRGETETRRDRRALADDAGFGPVSIASVFAGTLVAFGATILLLALAAAVASGAGLDDVDVQGNWRDAGVAGGAILASVLFVCYLFGGYCAGRMARRHGVQHGLLVFATSLVAVGVATVVARLLTVADADAILRNLRSVGVPTTGDEWRDAVTVAGAGSLAAMLLGSVVGGPWGERWHGRLVARALDTTGTVPTRVGGGVDLRDRDSVDHGHGETAAIDDDDERVRS